MHVRHEKRMFSPNPIAPDYLGFFNHAGKSKRILFLIMIHPKRMYGVVEWILNVPRNNESVFNVRQHYKSHGGMVVQKYSFHKQFSFVIVIFTYFCIHRFLSYEFFYNSYY